MRHQLFLELIILRACMSEIWQDISMLYILKSISLELKVSRICKLDKQTSKVSEMAKFVIVIQKFRKLFKNLP